MRREFIERLACRWMFCALLCAFPALAEAQGGAEEDAIHMRVVASGGVAGELFAAPCEDGTLLERSAFSSLAGTFSAQRHAGALVVDTGGLLARHAVTRFASANHPEALAALVQGLGYLALALGEADLGDTRETLLARLQALRGHVPVLATNLRCEESAQALCDHLATADDGVPYFVAEGAALLSFVEPEALSRIAAESREGLSLLPLTESIRSAVVAARARGARTVIAIIDSGRGADAFSRAAAAIGPLTMDERPDLVLSADAGSALLFARPADERPAFASAPPASAVTIRVSPGEGRLDFVTAPAEGAHAHPAMERFINAVGPAYCGALQQPLRGAHLTEPMDADDLATLSAGVMREVADADLAILNTAALDGRWQRPTGTLSRSDIQLGIQYDEPLVVGEARASWIRKLAREMPEGLQVPGLSISGAYTSLERITVGGRRLDDAATYRIATIRFLAEGGDGALPPGVEWEPVNGRLRSAVESFLDAPRDVDPREDLVDPFSQLEWSAHMEAALSFSGNAVRDRSGYGEGPLSGQGQVLVGLSSTFRLDATSRSAAWQNELIATYALSTSGEDGSFQEGSDQITYRTSAQLRKLRVLHDALYVPDLIVEGFVRTEFTADESNDAHFLSARFVAGPQWRLHPRLQVRLVGGGEVSDALDDERRTFEPGVGAQLVLSTFTLMREWPRLLTLATTLDYFASGFGSGPTRHLLQGSFALQLDLSRGVGLSLNTSLYGLKEGGPFAFALTSSVNLRVAWNRRWLRSP